MGAVTAYSYNTIVYPGYTFEWTETRKYEPIADE
jgi:hypothetical protein